MPSHSYNIVKSPKVVALLVCLLTTGGVEHVAEAQDELVSEPPVAEDQLEGIDALALRVHAADTVSAADRARLEEWLAYLSAGAKRSRLMGGTGSLAFSGLFLGVSIWAFLESDPPDELTRGAGMVGILASGAYMSLGIVQLAIKSEPEKTYGRWRATSAAELTALELARFEGELRQYTESAKRSLRRARWTGFGIAITGGPLLGLTPAADLSSDGATTGYVVGGALLGGGLLGFGFSFIGGSKLDYWQAYLQGRPPPRSRWSAAPQISRALVGGLRRRSNRALLNASGTRHQS